MVRKKQQISKKDKPFITRTNQLRKKKMHDLTDTSDVDSNLYPALLQVFTIILLGYLAGTLKIVNKEQSLGLNIFVGTFILPALLLKVSLK